MKRFLLLAALTLAWGSLWAQDVVRHINQATPDSIPATVIPADSVAVDEDEDDEPNVIGAKPSTYRKGGEANILGAPIYYDSTGRAYGTGEAATRTVHLPHFDETLHPVEIDRFNHYFFELELIGTVQNVAVGFNFTYLPKRVGVYGSALFGRGTQYYSLGAALRLSDRATSLDLHLYGGATWHHTLGAEAGIRIAETARPDYRFAWRSASIGWARFNGRNYLTLGLSLELAALVSWLFWW